MRNSASYFIVDAHILWWFLTAPERLSTAVSSIFRLAETGNAIILVPAIVVAEICFFSVKERQAMSPATLLRALESVGGIQLSELGRQQLELFGNLPEIPEMHDRLIAADALYHNAPLLTRDRLVAASPQIETIW